MNNSIPDVLATLGGIKPVFQGVSAIVTLVIGKFALKFDEDLPPHYLIVLAIIEIWSLSFLVETADQRTVLLWLVGGLVMSAIVFVWIYKFGSFYKIIDSKRRWWRFWKPRYGTIMIVGGFQLLPKAKSIIESENIPTQEYYAGVAYDEDRVWSRPSRYLARLTLIVSYFVMILCAVGLLFLISANWSKGQTKKPELQSSSAVSHQR